MNVFDAKGARLIKVTGLNDLFFASGKLVVRNDDDGVLYTLGCKLVDGEPVAYWSSAGATRVKNGKTQILNDDDGLWYSLGLHNTDGEPTLYFVQPGET